MNTAFTPTYTRELPLRDLTNKEFLVVALEAAQHSDWKVTYLSDIGFIAFTDYAASAWNAEIRITIENNFAQLRIAPANGSANNTANIKATLDRFITHFQELKPGYSQLQLALQYEHLTPHIVTGYGDVLKQEAATNNNKVKNLLSIFIPTQGYFITPLLINLNILLFILMVAMGANIMEPSSDILVKWGANFTPLTLNGQWWRILTNCFLHIGVVHLLLNMYALMYIGFLLEPYLGKTRFAAAYLLTGITASMTSLWWHDVTVSAGASGAIFGMYGVFLAMLTTNLIEKSARIPLLSSIAIFVGFNLVGGLKSGIDNAAHIGGLIGGLAIGYAYIPGLKEPENKRLKKAAIAVMTTLILTASVITYASIPNAMAVYEKQMNAFAQTEKKATDSYNLPASTPKDVLVKAFKETGIHYWEENLQRLNELDRLKLPAQLKARNQKLKLYCELRIKSYQRTAAQLEKGIPLAEFQADDNDRQIRALIHELSDGDTTQK